MHEDQMTQMVQMLGTVVAQLGRIEQRLDKIEVRLDKIEQRLDALEKRMDALEQRMDALEQRMDLIEQRVGILEAGAYAYESRFEAIETELRRLRALFEENERTLAIILEVLSNYVKKSEKVKRQRIIGAWITAPESPRHRGRWHRPGQSTDAVGDCPLD